MGVYVFERSVLDFLPGDRAFDIPDLVQAMIAKGKDGGEGCRAGVFEYSGYWLDIGRPDDYEEAQRVFAERRGAFLAEDGDYAEGKRTKEKG